MAAMAEVKAGKLVITIDFDESGHLSKQGKSKVHASTKGNIPTTVQVNGKPLILGVNAYTKL